MKLYKEAKIGLIAVVIIALFIWGYGFLKSRNIFKPRDSYYAVYKDHILFSIHFLLYYLSINKSHNYNYILGS